MLAKTLASMREFYLQYRDRANPPRHWLELEREMDACPETRPAALKAELYRRIARHARPTLFAGSPFFFETGMRYAENWGTPDARQPNTWMLRRHHQGVHSPQYDANARNLQRYNLGGTSPGETCLWNIYNSEGFDVDHHCPGYSRILFRGVAGLEREIAERLADPALTAGQTVELEAMLAGLAALRTIAAGFARTAERELAGESDPTERANLERIAATARRIPALPPETFYEGLQAMIFYREVIASLEGVGLSVLGRPDLLLIDLYRRDLAAGCLDETEARALIAHWMAVHDVKTFARERDWPETSTCLELGGCDAEGGEVFNELTRLFIEEHRRHDFINPKLNCRYSAASPAAYLELIADCVLAGHNHFACLNDEVLIPAQMRYGKTLADARNYVNGGCQETICEGVEHTAGGFFYINMPATLALWFTGRPGEHEVVSETVRSSARFEEVYNGCLDAVTATIRTVTGWARGNGELFREIDPGPLFSATLEGCVANASDYTAGGAKYNPTGVTLVGLANVVNSLYAVRRAVFEDRFVTLEDYIDAVRRDWPAECEALRRRIIALPRFGCGHEEVDELAARFSADVTARVRALPNERGGRYQPSYFVYWFFKHLGDRTPATPDGRRGGEYLTQGVSPDRVGAPDSVTRIIASLGRIDFRDAPGNAVWDWQLPFGAGLEAATVAAVLRRAAEYGVPTVQPNCVSVADMRDALVHPEHHGDLVVRISGLSAVFVRLGREVQEELIARMDCAV